MFACIVIPQQDLRTLIFDVNGVTGRVLDQKGYLKTYNWFLYKLF